MGSRYASFTDLRNYSIDVVKIDRSILNAAITRRGAALLHGITVFAYNLDMAVLCEGAQAKGQEEAAPGINCDYIQEGYFCQPLPLKETERVSAWQSLWPGAAPWVLQAVIPFFRLEISLRYNVYFPPTRGIF